MNSRKHKSILARLILLGVFVAVMTTGIHSRVYAATPEDCSKIPEGKAQNLCYENQATSDAVISPGDKAVKTSDECGGVKTSIDFGCTGGGNSIKDLGYAIIRFLSVGVVVVLIGAVVVTGIQYTMAEGNPGKVSAARLRLFQIVVALLIYIFAMAIVNFIVPGGILS